MSPVASFIPIILSHFSNNLKIVSFEIDTPVLEGTSYKINGIGEAFET